MTRAALVIAIAACGAFGACGTKDEREQTPWADTPHVPRAVIDASPPDASPPEPTPAVTFAAVSDTGVAIYRTGAAALAPVRAIKADGLDYDYDVAWTAADAPYVRIAGAVSSIAGDKLVPVALPPAKTFATPHKKDETRFDPPQQKLIATDGGELWLGRCAWGDRNPEEESCNEWAYARLVPAPVVTRRDAPEPRDGFDPPAIAPPAPVTAEIVAEHVIDAGSPDDFARTPENILRCTIGGKTIEYPAEDDRTGGSFGGMDHLAWLSADPPIFTIDREELGLSDAIPVAKLFDGCTAEDLDNVQIVFGPSDVVAIITGDRTTVRWHGRVLGTIDAGAVIFAPVR